MIPIILLTGMLAAVPPGSGAAALVSAERAFAADAQRLGVRLAFLAHFDADAFVFRPGPIPALPALARDPDDGTRLEWGPDLVGVAASGELGFSTGPWSLHEPGTAQAHHGHFITLWKRGDDGVWRVQADMGVGHAGLERGTPVAVIAPAVPDSSGVGSNERSPHGAARRAALERADDALRAALARRDSAALATRADPALHVLREGELPADAAAALARVAKDPPGLGRGPRRALDVAASGDFGYTLGGGGCSGCGSYLRVWRWSSDGWRVLVDASTPEP